MTIRLNISGKARVMNERGITTMVKNVSDGKVYWIGTTCEIDGIDRKTWITFVGAARMFGLPPKSSDRAWEITTATSEKEAVEIHFAVEELVQKLPRDKWESSLPDQRLVARKFLDEAEKHGLRPQDL